MTHDSPVVVAQEMTKCTAAIGWIVFCANWQNIQTDVIRWGTW